MKKGNLLGVMFDILERTIIIYYIKWDTLRIKREKMITLGQYTETRLYQYAQSP